MAVSFVFLIVGVMDIIWGFVGDAQGGAQSPSVTSRFESGIICLVVSFIAYLWAKKKQTQGRP